MPTKLGGAPCGFPFTVVQIDPQTLAFETLFENKVPTIPGASVAVRRGDALYLGTAFGDRMGPFTQVGPRHTFALGLHAQRIPVDRRVAAIGNAADRRAAARERLMDRIDALLLDD